MFWVLGYLHVPWASAQAAVVYSSLFLRMYACRVVFQQSGAFTEARSHSTASAHLDPDSSCAKKHRSRARRARLRSRRRTPHRSQRLTRRCIQLRQLRCRHRVLCARQGNTSRLMSECASSAAKASSAASPTQPAAPRARLPSTCLPRPAKARRRAFR